ncbi:hypothetical protein HZA43_02225 [Candidatus Peregrinibacteria bacterium]|nr:hypothetical protein [Candidatus Peregrinibacteria bacterium]
MKKILYVEINEEITAIFDRIRYLKASYIYLIVPKKAALFQSIVNLSILKSRLEEFKKKLVIVTTDTTGQYLARRIGIETYEQIEVKKSAPKEEPNPQTKNQPIQARRNELSKDTPKRFTEKKITLKELIHELRNSGANKKEGEILPVVSFLRSSRKFLIMIIALSVGLFGLISYLALAGATIYIQPKSEYIEYAANVILADKRKNQKLLREYNKNVIPSEAVNTVVRQTKVFNTISKEFQGIRSEGMARFINVSEEKWNLKKGTRLETSDGLIFKTKTAVMIPPAIRELTTPAKKNGEVIVPIVADDVDIYNNIIGDRGNIDPTTFFLPGLSKADQKIIWAVSDAPLKGGVTKYSRLVKQEDVDAAKNQMKSNMIDMAEEDLKTRLTEINKIDQTNLVLLDDPQYLKINLVDLKMSDDLLGSSRDKFEVYAEMSVQGFAFDFDQLFTMLVHEVKNRARPGRRVRLNSLDPKSVVYGVTDYSVEAGQIKITATVKGIEEFSIESEDNGSPSQFSQRVKEQVAGLPTAEAKNLIGNMPEVERVEIKTWPFWLDKMPPLLENITIKAMSDQ